MEAAARGAGEVAELAVNHKAEMHSDLVCQYIFLYLLLLKHKAPLILQLRGYGAIEADE